jgi:hypothetical protein
MHHTISLLIFLLNFWAGRQALNSHVGNKYLLPPNSTDFLGIPCAKLRGIPEKILHGIPDKYWYNTENSPLEPAHRELYEHMRFLSLCKMFVTPLVSSQL